MSGFFDTVTDFESRAETLRRRRYGAIEVVEGRLAAIHLRPWPKIVSLPEVWWLGERRHRANPGDRCTLYYNQPLRFPQFLALKYVVSSRDCTFATFRRAVVTLDWLARLKQTDALLCEATNLRISERLLHRWGWERHVLHSRRRHYIKRFYGKYPPVEAPQVAVGG